MSDFCNPMDCISEMSHLAVCYSLRPHGLYSPWDSLRQNTGMGSLSFLHGDLPNPGIEPRNLQSRQSLYQLSHKGSLRILEWVAYPFSRGSSQHRNQTRVSFLAGGFFTNWAIREAHGLYGPWNSPGQNTGVGSHSHLQGIFPTTDQTHVSHIAGGFFTSWTIREALVNL